MDMVEPEGALERWYALSGGVHGNYISVAVKVKKIDGTYVVTDGPPIMRRFYGRPIIHIVGWLFENYGEPVRYRRFFA